jgi:starch phosphorylase
LTTIAQMPNGYLHRQLPQELRDLSELALDLRWTTSHLTRRIWQRLDPDAWEQTENPHLILLNVTQERLSAAARDQELLAELANWRRKWSEYQNNATWFRLSHPASRLKRVAYFSMEFGLSEALPIYSGGLGVLAGDFLKSASDLGVPLVGIGLLYQQGYFRQVLADDGAQREAFPYNDPNSLPITPVMDDDGRWRRVPIQLPGRTLLLRIWKVQVGRTELLLLDSNDPQNSPWDRGITAHLYDAGADQRLLQEIVLGVGGWRLIDELGLEVNVCHLNEGHAAFAVLERAASFARQRQVPVSVALQATRAGNVFTLHTPLASGFDKFDAGLVAHYAGPFMQSLGLPVERLLALGRRDPADASEPFNMAYLAMRGCCRVNGVSRLHGEVSRRILSPLFPRWPEIEVPIGSITNGVHIPTWNSLPARRFWMEVTPCDPWLTRLPEVAASLSTLDPTHLWALRTKSRLALVEYVRRRMARQLKVRGAADAAVQAAQHVLDPNVLTLGFARRFAEYKRPNLLLRDVGRLKRLLCDERRPVQLIVAGKAHPNDEPGKALVRSMAQFAHQPELSQRVVFLEDYDMVLAQHLAAGIDVWLNTPRRPAEACGTSGMKMLFNGGLNVSTRDGWWAEAWSPDVGWAFGNGGEGICGDRDALEAEELYAVLEREVIPEFYDRDSNGMPHKWLIRLTASMGRLTPRFSSDRMLKEYVEQVYLPAAEAHECRCGSDARVACELEAWHEHLAEHWHGLHFGEIHVSRVDDSWSFAAQVYLGELAPTAVCVQLYANSPAAAGPLVAEMRRDHPLPGSVNGFVYTAVVAADRPADDFTPRIVPWHPKAMIPSEENRVHWAR